MSGLEKAGNAGHQRAGEFPVTHWSVLLETSSVDRSDASPALRHLCEAYWYPLYVYVRRLGHSPEDTQDLVQEFFARFVRKRYLRCADPARGRFRSFLLTSLKHFLINEWQKNQTQRRGGAVISVSFDSQPNEDRYQLEPADEATPETIFERRWAVALMERVLEQLRVTMAASNKQELFESLIFCVSANTPAPPVSELAARLGMSDGAVRVAIHRMREQFRELLRAEVAAIVASPSDIDDELRHLAGILRV